MKKLRKEITYPHPPERVWRALTDPALVAKWLMESDLEPRVGHKFKFRSKPQPGFDGIVHAEVVEADPPRRLAYTWRGGNEGKHQTLVEWTLTPVTAGTQLVLEHSGFEGIGGFFLRAMMNRGWGSKLTGPKYFSAVLNELAVANRVK
jgi:uncharacterized protein YndB with AHSA1/START domain